MTAKAKRTAVRSATHSRRQTSRRDRSRKDDEITTTAQVKFPPLRQRMDWDTALSLYRDDGWTFARIARAFDYSQGTVRVTLREMGAKRRRVAKVRQSERGRKLYSVWIEMRQRCRNSGHQSFRHYGGRGVTICDEWENFEVFARWALDQGYRSGCGLDLAEGEDSFSPAHCRIVSPQEQAQLRVQRFPPHHARMLDAFGESKTMTAWSKDPRCRVGHSMIQHRLARGLTAEQAISEPHGSDVVIAHMQAKTKRRGPKRRHATREELEQLHHVEGLSCAQVARRLGLTYTGAYDALRRHGLMRSTKSPGLADSEDRRLYHVWLHMHRACKNPKYPGWRYVGASGVGVDMQWDTSAPFIEWSRRSGASPGLCLVRIDRSKDYGPGNCEWVSHGEVVARAKHHIGRKRARVVVTAFGETKGAAAWAGDLRCNIGFSGLVSRLRKGWDPELAITTPPMSSSQPREKPLTAFGTEKGLSAWIRDRRCKLLAVDSLRARLERGMTPEDAIRTPPYAKQAYATRRRAAPFATR